MLSTRALLGGEEMLPASSHAREESGRAAVISCHPPELPHPEMGMAVPTLKRLLKKERKQFLVRDENHV